MPSRSNIADALITGSILGAGTKWGQLKQTIAAEMVLTTNHPPLLFIDATATSRDILLPAEASSKGLFFRIVNASTGAADLIVKEDADTVVIGVVGPGSVMDFYCDGTTWFSVGAGGPGVVAIPDAATYTVLRGDSGKVHVLPNLTATCTVTLPVPVAGVPLEYEFWYGGAAADAQDWVITTGFDVNYYIGGVVFMDQDGDVMSPVYADGNSNSKLTVVKPEVGTVIRVKSAGILWYLQGQSFSATTPALADQ